MSVIMEIDKVNDILSYHSTELRNPENVKLINDYYKDTDSPFKMIVENNTAYIYHKPTNNLVSISDI